MPANILIVDDSLTVRIMLRRLLEVVDFPVGQVQEARDGQDRMRAGRPDLVLSDLNMDGMSGFDMIDHMRLDPALAAVPVVVISSEGNPDVSAQLAAKGVRDVIRKPFDLASVSALLARVMAGTAR
jgi:two-component system chemotaxis response regulator CheY